MTFNHIARGLGKDPQSTKLEFWGDIPRLTIIGQYTAKGSVLILPIVGHGITNITMGKNSITDLSTINT